jgi:hypothetical protein
MEEANAKVGRETVHQPTIGRYSRHDSTNENGLRLINFAAGRQLIHLDTCHPPDGCTRNQINDCFIDGRHFSDAIDLKARRGANIDSDHMLVVKKLRDRKSRASNTTPQQLRRDAVELLNDGNVATMYRHELEAELSNASEPEPLSLNVK